MKQNEDGLVFGAKKYICAFEITMDLIGGKWKGLVLWHLGTNGTLRFGQLRKLLSQATPKTLTQKLRELEADNLIYRRVYYGVPPKVEYSLTDLGESLMPILKQMRDWGTSYYVSCVSENEE